MYKHFPSRTFGRYEKVAWIEFILILKQSVLCGPLILKHQLRISFTVDNGNHVLVYVIILRIQ